MAQEIYVGRWTDWSYGSVLGDRITIPTSYGRYVISFVATFNVWVGTAAWLLFAFTLHQHRTTGQPRDAIFHQVQAALRNSTTSLSYKKSIFAISRAWSGNGRHTTTRILKHLTGPMILSSVFTVAGIWSARIASSGDVLLKGSICGLVNDDIESDYDAVVVTLVQNSQDGVRMTLSNSYAQQCYINPLDPQRVQLSNSDASHLTCEDYAQSALNFTVMEGIEFPFEAACLVPSSNVLRLDTGYLDSHHDLGLNQPPENRVLFRKTTTCSPLSAQGFADNSFGYVKDAEQLGNISVYSYGNNPYQPTRFAVLGALPYSDATFIYPANTYEGSQSAYYLMVASTMLNFTTGQRYTPSSAISSDPTKPISLMFLANRAFFQDSVDDPWFNATMATTREADLGYALVNETFYLSENPGSVLACLEQVQVCNPIGDAPYKCTNPDEWYLWAGFHEYYRTGNLSILADLGLNNIQQVTAAMVLEAALEGSVWNVVDQLGDKALIASNYISLQQYFWSSTLANNQWQIEVANWFSVGLAQIQRIFIRNYRRPTEDILLKYWEYFPENATNEQVFYANQKVQNSDYTSFSVIGLALNLGLGCLILLAGHSIPTLVPKLQRKLAERRGNRSTASDHWIMNSAIQQQRMVFQLHGRGYWIKQEERIPITGQLEPFEAPPLLNANSQASFRAVVQRSSDEAGSRTDACDRESFQTPGFPMRDIPKRRGHLDGARAIMERHQMYQMRPPLQPRSTSERLLLDDTDTRRNIG